MVGGRRGGALLLRVAAAALVGVAAAPATSSGPATASAQEGPCDLYARGGTPCVAAHSLTRSLYANYTGPLYLVARDDGATLPVHTAAGVAVVAPLEAFCAPLAAAGARGGCGGRRRATVAPAVDADQLRGSPLLSVRALASHDAT